MREKNQIFIYERESYSLLSDRWSSSPLQNFSTRSRRRLVPTRENNYFLFSLEWKWKHSSSPWSRRMSYLPLLIKLGSPILKMHSSPLFRIYFQISLCFHFWSRAKHGFLLRRRLFLRSEKNNLVRSEEEILICSKEDFFNLLSFSRINPLWESWPFSSLLGR